MASRYSRNKSFLPCCCLTTIHNYFHTNSVTRQSALCSIRFLWHHRHTAIFLLGPAYIYPLIGQRYNSYLFTSFLPTLAPAQKKKARSIFGLSKFYIAISFNLSYNTDKGDDRPQSGWPPYASYNPTCTAKHKVGLFIFACCSYLCRQAARSKMLQTA